VPDPTLVRLNRGLAAQLSIDADWLASAAIRAANFIKREQREWRRAMR